MQTEKERVKLVYRIKIDVLKNPDWELKSGMPADARIVPIRLKNPEIRKEIQKPKSK